jgi:uncharacterized protein YegL
MRRLPIFFVLDVSESMAGDNIRVLNKGVENLVRTLRMDPHALESVYLSVIVFAGKAKTLTPLIELSSFYPPRLPLGSGTSLGKALDHLMSDIDKSVVKTTHEVKGDWKPVVYLLTDGKPTDEAASAIMRWKDSYSKKASLVTVGIGSHADMSTLRQLTENTFRLIAESEADFMKFIQWMSLSVSAQSRSVSAGPSEGLSLAKIDENVLKKVDEISKSSAVDEDFVILTGKCSSTKLPYVMRYEKVASPEIRTSDFRSSADMYSLNGVYPMELDYFELSDERALVRTVNSNALLGAPGCPHCGNPFGFAVCSCGGVMCIKGPGKATCPWCGETDNYGMMSPDSEGADVNRSRG